MSHMVDGEVQHLPQGQFAQQGMGETDGVEVVFAVFLQLPGHRGRQADHDLILLEHSLKMYRNLGNAAFLVMGMANHFMPWEESDRLNNEIEGFFKKSFQQKNLVPKEYEFLLD